VIQQVLRSVDFSFCSELALSLFFLVFVIVTLRTLLSNRNDLQGLANRAIQDHQERIE
jgi:hypothetical protein